MERARKLLSEAKEAVREVRAFDARQKTVVVKSCAPAPLWELLKKIGESHPEMTVSSGICQNDEVLSAWEDGSCDIAILPFPVSDEKGCVQTYMEEHLFVYVEPEHELATHTELPCFTTDYGMHQPSDDFHRISIPITDEEANVTFYIAVSKNCRIPCSDLLITR